MSADRIGWHDYRGRAVLITGGTKGIGLAIGVAFAKRGADVTLTQKWGSADAAEIRAAFAAAGATEPSIVDADVSQDADTRSVLEQIRSRHDRLDALISNVAFAPLVRTMEDYTRRGLATAIDYSTWPLVSYTRTAHAVFGHHPRYVVGLSSEGADSYHVNYDIVAAAKAALEALCRYLNHRLRDGGTRVNVVRTRFASTDALVETFGDAFEPFVEKHSPGIFTTPAEVAEGVFGLCSGLMDGVGGQVVTVDRGAAIFDNFSRLYDERARGTLVPQAITPPAPSSEPAKTTSKPSTTRLYDGRVVLVTGGTKGIGLATALAFARHGARAVLTHKWGSADEAELAAQFRAIEAPPPLIVEADISRSADTHRLFETIKAECGRVDAVISNASAAVTVQTLDDLTERAFLKSMRASAWPAVEYALAAKQHLGAFPRHVIVMSSDGPDRFTPAYDFVACGKAAAETLARYLAYRLRGDDVRVNVIRSRAIKTDAFADTFGAEFYNFLRRFVRDDWFMTADEVAAATFAVCSGMFDAMTGQVVMVDRGNTFADGISVIYEQRAELGL